MELLTNFVFSAWSVLIQLLIFGTVLAVGVRLALAMVAPPNASTRFAAWFATLLGIAVLPAGYVLTSWATNFGEQRERPISSAVRDQLPAPARSSSVRSPGTAARSIALTESHPASAAPPAPEPSIVDFQARIPIRPEAAFVALLLYAGIVLCLLGGRLGVGYRRLQRLKASSYPAPEEVQERFRDWLALCSPSRPSRILLSSSVRSPMAVGFNDPAIIIPDSLLLRMTGDELDHVGLHELAHIRRYDDWTNLIQKIVQSLFFFHPAVHWICRRLDFEREVACDDWVLTLTGEARPYARSLTKVLEQTPWMNHPILASGALFRKRQIFRRIELMLDSKRDFKPRISGLTFAAIVLCLFGALTEIVNLTPVVAFISDPGGSVHRSTWNNNGHKIEIVFRGDVQFGDDDNSIRSISPNGYLRIMEKNWIKRELEVKPVASGGAQVSYRVDGRDQAIDQKAQEWASSMIMWFIRENAINAEARAIRILETRGESAVLDEIDRISSSHSRRQYLAAIIKSGRMEQDGLRRAMMRVARIPSDHDRANLLLDVAGVYATEELRGTFFDTLNKIGSDHERRRVLTQVLAEAEKEPAVLMYAGRAVAQMSSDHEKAELLRRHLPSRLADADANSRRPIIRAIETIGSDHEKAKVVSEILEEERLPGEVLGELLRVMGSIQSDHERSQVLKRLIDRDVQGIDPDRIVQLIAQISSDNEKANLLVKLAAAPPGAAHLSAVRSIQSDSEKRRVLQAMVERGGFASAGRGYVEIASTISSDHEKAQALTAIAKKFQGDADVRAAVRRAAEKISSDSDYRRIVSQLYSESGEAEPKAR